MAIRTGAITAERPRRAAGTPLAAKLTRAPERAPEEAEVLPRTHTLELMDSIVAATMIGRDVETEKWIKIRETRMEGHLNADSSATRGLTPDAVTGGRQGRRNRSQYRPRGGGVGK
mmetsp:Transcript_15977/g.38899  ORF Transcript_15977/g.38899 Transcript_15977/m.38899 type:complete len:116 (-) Transcript_15977:21-368(-)